MPLLDLQRRMRELGRIRTGLQVPTKTSGKSRPEKLETFRLTSPARDLLDAAAEIYGGDVRPWVSPAGAEWELVTKADVLDIVIPPGQAMSQWWEMWSGGGCVRRCDGVTNVLADEPCACPSDPLERRTMAGKGDACKPTTRLNVILPALPDIGVWRLESHGYYAAVELAGTAEFLERATASGKLLPARLRLDQREQKRPGEPTRRFAVPVIELPQTRMAEFMGLAAGSVPVALAAGAPPERTVRHRVERPVMPSGPDLPDGSNFTKATANFGMAPETLGGWQITDDEIAEPPGLSMDEFRTLVNSGQPRVTRQAIAAGLFADCGIEVMPSAVAKAVEELTDQQRATLADGLRLRG